IHDFAASSSAAGGGGLAEGYIGPMHPSARAPATAARLTAAFACCSALGCGPGPQAKGPARADESPPAEAAAGRSLPQLNERERQFSGQLRQHVEELSVKI